MAQSGREIAGTERLLLRPLEPDDVRRVESWLERVRARYAHIAGAFPREDLTGMPPPVEPDELAAYWAIDTRDDRHVGMALWWPDYPFLTVYDITLILSPELKGWDWGAEAARLVVDHLFRTRPATKVVGKTAPFHRAAIAIMRRLGAREEARLRKHVVYAGEPTDLVVYGLLREEWEAAGCGEVT